ncbi:unnamed protein product (macronuclear) [Paramecium tetraurelia]|uniref:Uncharacterized protein n=1 Tax=Paramecium tetraurelia TaxID=5888 RepID=A0D8N9_PARTE|nr:uncharacterized protein GSPATT00014352001 [Paramecium tetraurelia]CAK79406.1 unnamed protein product [Paramecium tetraurelia]|eukprot:XP_001446803.1 hypothetical protein (macronuclear) [Paramecium tetraurelia strain d4-2]
MNNLVTQTLIELYNYNKLQYQMNFNTYLLQLPKLTPITMDDSYRQLGIIKNKSPFRIENRDIFYLMNKSQFESLYSNPKKLKTEKQQSLRNHSFRMHSCVNEKGKEAHHHSFVENNQQHQKQWEKKKNTMVARSLQRPEFRNKSETLCLDQKNQPESIQKLQNRKLLRNPKIMLKELWDENYGQ